MTDRSFSINFSTLGLLKLLLFGIAGYFVYVVRVEIALLFAAIIFAAALDPAVQWFEERGWSRALGLSIVYIAVIGAVVASVVLVIPVMGDQVDALSERVPQIAASITHIFEQWHLGGAEEVNAELVRIRDAALDGSRIASTFASSVQGFLYAIVFLVLTFYLVMAEKNLRALIEYFVPKEHQQFANELLTHIQDKLGNWLRNQLLVMLAVGVASYLALLIIGVPGALVFGLLAGVLEIIPYFGPVMAVIPPMIVAFATGSTAKLFIVAIAYFVIQQLQSNLLTPRLMGKNAGLNPLVIMVAVLVGARISGIVGSLLAVPVATLLSVVITEFVSEKWPKSNQ